MFNHTQWKRAKNIATFYTLVILWFQLNPTWLIIWIHFLCMCACALLTANICVCVWNDNTEWIWRNGTLSVISLITKKLQHCEHDRCFLLFILLTSWLWFSLSGAFLNSFFLLSIFEKKKKRHIEEATTDKLWQTSCLSFLIFRTFMCLSLQRVQNSAYVLSRFQSIWRGSYKQVSYLAAFVKKKISHDNCSQKKTDNSIWLCSGTENNINILSTEQSMHQWQNIDQILNGWAGVEVGCKAACILSIVCWVYVD